MNPLYTAEEVAAIPLFQSAAARRMLMPAEPAQHARKIADSLVSTWASQLGSAGLDVVVGTTAALAVLPVMDTQAGSLAAAVAALRPRELCELLDRTWQRLYWSQPAIVERLRPLRRWLDAPEAWQADGALLVAQTAIVGGLLELTHDKVRVLETDLLGYLMQRLRGRADKSSFASFHTPTGAADLIAEVLGIRQDEIVIMEPAAGSGSLWRAAAADLHARGQSPADKTWIGVELDEMSAAVLAANSVIWRLGPNVLIARADAIREADSGVGTALLEHRAAHARRDALLRAVRAAAEPDRPSTDTSAEHRPGP